jgi:hypothetical protein
VRVRDLLYFALLAIFLLHNDLWWWDDPRRVFGMPIGLTYHIALCLAAALILWLLTRGAEPQGRPPR